MFHCHQEVNTVDSSIPYSHQQLGPLDKNQDGGTKLPSSLRSCHLTLWQGESYFVFTCEAINCWLTLELACNMKRSFKIFSALCSSRVTGHICICLQNKSQSSFSPKEAYWLLNHSPLFAVSSRKSMAIKLCLHWPRTTHLPHLRRQKKVGDRAASPCQAQPWGLRSGARAA